MSPTKTQKIKTVLLTPEGRQPYTKNIVDLICQNLRAGIKRDECYIGIVGRSTFYKWLKEKPEFKEAVRLAEFNCKKKCVDYLHRGMEKDTKWAAWWLERKYKEEFGAQQQQNEPTSINMIIYMPERKLDANIQQSATVKEINQGQMVPATQTSDSPSN